MAVLIFFWLKKTLPRKKFIISEDPIEVSFMIFELWFRFLWQKGPLNMEQKLRWAAWNKPRKCQESSGIQKIKFSALFCSYDVFKFFDTITNPFHANVLWKGQKTRGFLMFSGGIEIEHFRKKIRNFFKV